MDEAPSSIIPWPRNIDETPNRPIIPNTPNPCFDYRRARSGTPTGVILVRTANRGAMAVESEPGKGATFIVRLPFKRKWKVENEKLMVS